MEIKYFSALTGQDRYGLKDLLQKITIDIDNQSKIIDIGSGYEFYYKTDRPTNDQVKDFLATFESKKDRLDKLDKILAVFNNDISVDEPAWGRHHSGFQVNGDTYKFTFEDSKKITLDDIAYMTGSDLIDIPKSFWRGTLQNINLGLSSKSKIMELIIKDRVDIFRIIGKRSGVQLTNEELKTLIALPHFSRITSSGLIGRGETADIVNRRSVIFHQDACDDDIVLEIMNTFETNQAKESFMKSLNRKSIVEKFKDSPVVQILTKLG